MIELIDASNIKVRKFGILFGCIGLLLAAYMLYRGSDHWLWPAGSAVFFFVTAFIGYSILKPVYIGWMTFAFALGWVNTRVLLGLFYYLVLTPIGVILRISGKDLLDQKIDRDAPTYWKKREQTASDPSSFERLF